MLGAASAGVQHWGFSSNVPLPSPSRAARMVVRTQLGRVRGYCCVQFERALWSVLLVPCVVVRHRVEHASHTVLIIRKGPWSLRLWGDEDDRVACGIHHHD